MIRTVWKRRKQIDVLGCEATSLELGQGETRTFRDLLIERMRVVERLEALLNEFRRTDPVLSASLDAARLEHICQEMREASPPLSGRRFRLLLDRFIELAARVIPVDVWTKFADLHE